LTAVSSAGAGGASLAAEVGAILAQVRRVERAAGDAGPAAG
jgi:hypothetical protein